MIKVTNERGISHHVHSTAFPDGTSQVWKLPDELVDATKFDIVWNFEAESELIDLCSLNHLLSNAPYTEYISLHMPYLPYARQDKPPTNDATFNLEVFAKMINSLEFDAVSAVDVHNPYKTKLWIDNFINLSVAGLHKRIVKDTKVDFIIFPDKGALGRYVENFLDKPVIACDKIRDQLTGEITGTKLILDRHKIFPGAKCLIVDDICDGGATFIGVAKALHEHQPLLKVDLFVTHGIFSKGRDHLHKNGINEIYTTDSLLRNKDGFNV